MNIVQELINQLKTKCKTGSTQEKEKIAVDFLCGIDFSDADIKNQSKKYIGHILNDIVAKNQQLTSLDAKIIHCMVTKISLDNLGLKDVKINYRDKTAADRNAGAYYDESNKSINFFNQSVCNEEDYLSVQTYAKPELNSGKRLGYFCRQVHVLEHEIQHAVQFREMDKAGENKTPLTPESYIMSRQRVARTFARDASNSKYSKEGLEPDRLYQENHNQFYYELDADKHGIERMLNFVREVSPQAYQVATDPSKNTYVEKLKTKTDQLKNYSAVAWNHDTNPDKMEVSANHKASMIIDNILPRLSGQQRAEYMDKFPALAITYKQDGTIKSLEEVEREKQTKIDELITNGTDKETQKNAANVAKVYDTAIESHPVLCFEKCLQHIARLSYDSDRYFTDSGLEVKYDPSQIQKELRMAEQKARTIAQYLEDSDARQLMPILKKYEKEIFASSKQGQANTRFFENKKLALYGIENNINHNKEVKSVIEQDKRKAADERAQAQMKKEQAEETIKKVFPGFTPAPQKGRLENGSVIFSDNTQEKLILMEAYKRYINTITGNDKVNKTDKDFVSSDKLLIAIKHLYGFNVPIEEYKEFYAKLKNNEIDILQNKYEQKEKQTATEKASGAYTEDDTKDYFGQTFHMKAKTPNVPKPERQSHPEDPESDAAKAMFQSQRRVASEQYREMMEENSQTGQREVRPVTEEELEAIKQQHPELDTAKREEELRQQEIARQRAEHKKQQEEDSYLDEYGVAMKRNSDSGQNVRQRTQQNMGFSR